MTLDLYATHVSKLLDGVLAYHKELHALDIPAARGVIRELEHLAREMEDTRINPSLQDSLRMMFETQIPPLTMIADALEQELHQPAYGNIVTAKAYLSALKEFMEQGQNAHAAEVLALTEPLIKSIRDERFRHPVLLANKREIEDRYTKLRSAF
ncbi:MAG: hypothetical protein HC945_01495 [Nitrosarchaeum sp.]|nr:hypothetical protein [Nitrosarchaeum sp.]